MCVGSPCRFTVFRGTNYQKYCIKQDRNALVWGKPPVYVDGKLLVSGWWGLARKINYTGDLMLALSFALPAGFSTWKVRSDAVGRIDCLPLRLLRQVSSPLLVRGTADLGVPSVPDHAAHSALPARRGSLLQEVRCHLGEGTVPHPHPYCFRARSIGVWGFWYWYWFLVSHTWSLWCFVGVQYCAQVPYRLIPYVY